MIAIYAHSSLGGVHIMLRKERQDRIVQMIQHFGYATVPQLCRQFEVSPATLRRDLNELEEARLILRNRNGAVPFQEHHTEASVHFRAVTNAKAKEKIARAACELISDDSLIFIDSSTTALSIVNYLDAKRNLTIVSNSLQLMTLMRDSKHHVVLTGGQYYAPSQAFYGPFAEEVIRSYNFDVAFISSVAITPDGFAAETLEHSVPVRQAALERATATALMCDSTKIGLHRPYNIASIDRMKWVITDAQKGLENANTQLIRV